MLITKFRFGAKNIYPWSCSKIFWTGIWGGGVNIEFLFSDREVKKLCVWIISFFFSGVEI